MLFLITVNIISSSGLSQSALGIMADIGVLLRFNFLKFYNSREPNVKIGISARNLGISLTNFSGANGIKLDDPLPTILAAGISITLVEPVTLSLDFKQPIKLFDINSYLLPYISLGVSVSIFNNFSILAGIEVKGANPRISAGAEFQFSNAFTNALNFVLGSLTESVPYFCYKITHRLKHW